MHKTARPFSIPHNLPRHFTPFIDREQERPAIARQLADPLCRLLTLAGPGGIGKTRLAIAVASEILAHNGDTLAFADGIYFVNLQSVEAADLLAATIIDALNYPLADHDDPAAQLLLHLADKALLILRDNFEHLSEEGVGLILDILDHAPKVKLLVTSREVLNLCEEYVYHIHGLPVPAHDAVDKWQAYGATQLFIARAQRVRRDFDLTAERAGIVRICQMVEGMPLALELAAVWTKTLDCATIADEISDNIDFLTTQLRNTPAQHSSIQAIFEQSWARLSAAERAVFKKLAVFRGGFKRHEAEAVAGASLPVLSALLDKSLLRWEPDGRYQIHELLRQYADEKLCESPAEAHDVQQLHCHYFVDFLAALTDDMVAWRQREAIAEITDALENVRAAWQWAVANDDVAAIHKAAPTFYNFTDFQSRFQEGVAAFAHAIAQLEQRAPSDQATETVALLTAYLGWHYIRLGQFDDSRATFMRSQQLYAELDMCYPPGFGTDARLGLGLLAHVLGNFEEAVTLAEASRLDSATRGDALNLQIALYVLENAHFAQGHTEIAQHYAQQAYVLTKESGNRWMTAQFLRDLGHMARVAGDYILARGYFQESYDIKAALDDQEGMATSLIHLGRIALTQSSYDEARRLYVQAVQICRQINDRGALASALCGLGYAAVAQDERDKASKLFAEALAIAAAIQILPLKLCILTGIASLLQRAEQVTEAVELLALVLHHPAGEHETKAQARAQLDQLEAQLSTTAFTAAIQRGTATELDDTLAAVQAMLAALPTQITRAPAPATVQPANTERTLMTDEMRAAGLVESLTAREMEVLEHIAQGLTNQQIAEELILSTGTIKWYTGQIYGKLGVAKRTQAVARAREVALLA